MGELKVGEPGVAEKLSSCCCDERGVMLTGGLTHMSMRPTRSVVDTPSVRLMVTNRPTSFAALYASVPSWEEPRGRSGIG